MFGDVARALVEVEQHPDYKVLRRFKPRHAYGAVLNPKIGLYVDVETTGLNTELDRIIQFAAVRFEFDPESGDIGHIGPTYCGLEDPGLPLDPEIVEITGLTNEQLKGHRINDEKVAELMRDAVLVVAHNADFDRKMTEARIKGFDALPWGCSQRDVKWEKFGCRGAKLDYLVMLLCGEFFDGHNALNDCLAGVHLLATSQANGATPFQMLLESVRTPTYRLFAYQAGFHMKEKLRVRRYRWYPDPVKAWAKDVKADELEAERTWLRQEVYGSVGDQSGVKKISAYDRFSVRAA